MRVPFPTALCCLLATSAIVACRSGGGGSAPAPVAPAPEIPAARIPPELVEQTLRDSRAREDALAPDENLDLLERRFARMNMVAMGRDPDGGRPINTLKNESPEFRELARLLRNQLGDAPVDTLGEQLADRGLAALLGDHDAFRVPLKTASFEGDDPGRAARDILAWTRDLPLILAHHGLVAPDNRSVLPRFTLRTLLRARWNIETGVEPTHAFSTAEQIAWFEFRGRWRTWAPLPDRRAALEELARLLPSYPLREALDALVRQPSSGGIVIHEENN